MIQNILIDYLDTGAIAVYDLDQNQEETWPYSFYTLEFADPLAQYEGTANWQERLARAPRIWVPLNLDAALAECQFRAPEWIELAQQLPGNGTLIVSVQSWGTLPGSDVHYVLAGMAYVPQLIGVPILNLDLNELVLHILYGHRELVREVLAHHRDELNLHHRYQELADRYAENQRAFWERTEAARAAERVNHHAAFKRAARLLAHHLTPKQRRELRRKNRFHVEGQDGQLYRIEALSHQNVFLIQDGRPTFQYCLVCQERMPVPDLLLAQKFLLETNIWHFMSLANSWDLRERERVRVQRLFEIPARWAPLERNQQQYVNRQAAIREFGVAV